MSSQSTKTPVPITVYCGGLCETDKCNSQELNLLSRTVNSINANVVIGIDKFIKDPENISPRILDLLHIAAYVFCADRLIYRGNRYSLDNTAWARSFNFNIPVADYSFWSNKKVIMKMEEALTFMTGDRNFKFSFKQSNREYLYLRNPQMSLFTPEYTDIGNVEDTDIMLFSGGLDSLAGAIQRLNDFPNRKLCLVSHKANTVTTHTQDEVAKYLKETYFNRILQYGFKCHNSKTLTSREETQRSRMFLFSSIAFAICSCYNKKELFIHENGITSINLPKQGDSINARTSRTTHPKTIGLLRDFYKLFKEDFEITTPYYNKTKRDIIDLFVKYEEEKIISSSVSCSSTRSKPGNLATHCGCCSQCIDRRLAIYAAKLEDYDTTYATDIIKQIPDKETIQRIYNTLRLACQEWGKNKNELLQNFTDEISDVIAYWPNDNNDNYDDSLGEIYQLFERFGDSVIEAIKLIKYKHEDPRTPINKNSLLGIVSERDYLNTPICIKVNQIDKILRKKLPMMFQHVKPDNEQDMNDKVQSILSDGDTYTREYPVLTFGETEYRADHSIDKLVVESKYLRGKTSKSAISDGIGADITKIPQDVAGILFIVYDPNRKITDDDLFINGFENKRRNCFVRVYR